jgi:hypothetical protein
MRPFKLFFLILVLRPSVFSQEMPIGQPPKGPRSPLEEAVDRFDVSDAILRDGLSELSLKGIEGLHLGFEEIIRDKIQDDPRAVSSHFSLHLERKKVRQIINALCESDGRYTWSEDGASVNVYPQAAKGDPSYLFNVRIERIDLKAVPGPDQALTPLSKLLPDQQIGYFGPGLGDNTYAQPWTAIFEHVTVRQFIDRIAEHMGPQTSWVWEGGKQERMFTFLRGGFNSLTPGQ